MLENVDKLENIETLGVLETLENASIKENARTYKEVSKRIDNWLVLHTGESFDLDMICRQCSITESTTRNYATIILARKVKQGNLAKLARTYTIVSTLIRTIDWVNASELETFNICWPSGRNDGSHFGFDGHVVLSPGDVVVVAGGSNFGKTTFALNLLWDNMDSYPCTLMGNEYAPAKFKRRVANMTWANPLTEDGKPKFELIERRERWQDIIRPDNLNIIDWINLGDNFYQIGKIIEGIQTPLRNGVAVVVLQKSEGKELGMGGGFSEHLASLYLSIDYQRLTVVKCKEFNGGFNPNKHTYAFNIVDAGTKFDRIREVIKCKTCYGTGKYKSGECETCEGIGWMDKSEKSGGYNPQ